MSDKVLLKFIFINGNEKRVATPPPKFYLKYPRILLNQE
jgi:hypothetical protein